MKDIKKLILTLVALLAVTTGAYAASVSYVDGNGTSQTVDATELESTTTSWTDGSWYIVPEGGLTISGRIAVSGTVNLILRDGTELTASAGITTTNATLNIYAQSTGTGALTATGASGAAKFGGNAGIGGIGVGDYASGGAGGIVNIYGGTVTATGGNGGLGGGGGAGIGGGGAGWNSKEGSGAGGTVNIYGGTVTATGGNGGTGGGGGTGIGGGGVGWQNKEGSGAGGTVNIYGGTVTATGGTGGNSGGVGAGIGGGGNGMTCSAGADGTLTLGVGVKLYNGTDNTGTVLDDNDSESRNYSGSRPQNMYAEGTVVPSASTGPEVDGPTIVDGKPQWTFTMPGGNVTLEPDYYPQATAAEGAVTAADADARATTDDPLVKVDATKLTGAKKLMYFVSNSGTAPAYDAEGWTVQLPTAEGFTQQGTVYVWYYPVGTDEGVDGATATYSDGDMNATALEVNIAAAPTYAVTFAEGVNPEPPAEPEWTASPAAGVTKGQTVTVTYTGSKKVIGVKAEKKAAAPASTPLDNTTTAWTAGSYAVPAGGLTYSDAITVSGDVTLTLTDGETLTLNKGISLASGATLTIEGNGTMNVNGTNNSTASTVAGSTGTLILTSGTLTAKGGNGQDMTDGFKTGASGGAAINGSVTVNGGSLTANGGNGGNCIGATIGPETNGGAGGAAISGDVTITDGAVAATGGNGGSIGASNYGEEVHGGAGGAAIGGNATLTGGTLTATQGANGTGSLSDSSVGTGGKAVAGTVTNNGGTVNQ